MGQHPQTKHHQDYTRVTFGQMPIGTQFRTTPTTTAYGWLKVSTRTARINGNGKVYYYCQGEGCYVESAHWAEMSNIGSGDGRGRGYGDGSGYGDGTGEG